MDEAGVFFDVVFDFWWVWCVCSLVFRVLFFGLDGGDDGEVLMEKETGLFFAGLKESFILVAGRGGIRSVSEL